MPINSDIKKVIVNLGQRSYEILIGSNLLTNPSYFADLATKHDIAVIVSNTTVAKLYIDKLHTSLSQVHKKVINIILPDGEQYKDLATVQLIFDAMLKQRCDRKVLIYALGGGVIGDMAGFAAACYMRGVDFVQVPTTLLAQVDSSIGGKTGVNHSLGKNMIGAFYQPQRVICDVQTLTTLPQRELLSGLGEAIKYGPIFDQQFFQWLENSLNDIMQLNEQALIKLIIRSCEIKAHIVSVDEQESGMRAILNFGHTFAHAIETGLGYGTWLHGEAVSAGMIMAADLSNRLNLLDSDWTQRLRSLLTKAKLPTVAPNLGVDKYLELIQVDKKNQSGKVKFVLIEQMGKAVLKSVPDDLLVQVIKDNCN